jgi:NTP pyrophosphatase (non-canonical NTP hydrolase)
MELDLDKLQKEVIENKKNHGWATDNLYREFCWLYGEVGEAFDAYNKQLPKEEFASELADIAIYLMGIAEIQNVSLSTEIEKKMDINRHRKYIVVDGKTIKVDDRDPKYKEYVNKNGAF